MWFILELQYSTVTTVLQNSLMPAINSAIVFGLHSVDKYTYRSCQTSSIGFKPGDYAGAFLWLMLFSRIKAFVTVAVWEGQLSICKMW